jgi:acetylornithine deacetylase/succinyl-diaminopimelate desuccinylase-like protein
VEPIALEDRPAEILQRLIRFDTSNPPGNERECIDWLRGLLEDRGCDVRILARDPARPNLIARLPGRGVCGPLLLQGHVDVVAARGDWRHGPFAGELHDGYVWGRGALDMKGGVAMMLAAFMRAVTNATPPPGDVILCILADEEAGSDLGANFLVSEHADLLPGPGRWITIYANAGHVWMEVAGWRFDTVALAEGGTRWARGGGEFAGFVVRHPPGL